MLEKANIEGFEFKELQVNEYYFLDRDMRTTLSDYYVSQTDCTKGITLPGFSSGNCCGFGLYHDNNLLSYAITIPENRTLDIVYIFTKLSERGKGLASTLVEKICSYYNGRKRIHVTDTFPAYGTVVSVALKSGFVISESSTVYSLDINEEFWQCIASRGIDRIKSSESAECLAFKDLGEGQLEQIKNSCENEFGNVLLSPANIICNPATHIDRSLSFAYFKNKRLLAYTLITQPRPGHAVIEQIATARDYIGKGLVLYPLSASLRAAKEQGLVKKASMAIMENNEASKKLVLHILRGLNINRINNENYYRF